MPGATRSDLVRFWRDPALLQRIGEAGRAYVRAEHDWAVAAAQLEQVYTRLPSLKEEVSVCA